MRNNNQKFSIWWDEKRKILRTKCRGNVGEEEAEFQKDEILEMIGGLPAGISLLSDLSEAGRASSKARKIFAELLKNKNIKKHAFVSPKICVRIILSFVIKFSGVKNAKYFSTEEEALAWLKE